MALFSCEHALEHLFSQVYDQYKLTIKPIKCNSNFLKNPRKTPEKNPLEKPPRKTLEKPLKKLWR